jgi:hypothetical protein
MQKDLIKTILQEMASDNMSAGDPDFEIVYRTDDMLLVVPKTKSAACRYGSGTRWCTANPEYDQGYSRSFENKTKDGILYYLLIYKDDPEVGKKEFYKISIYKKIKTGSEEWQDMSNRRIGNMEMFKKFILTDPMVEKKIVEYWKKRRPEWKPKFKIGDYVQPTKNWGYTTFKDAHGKGQINMSWDKGVYLVVSVNPASVTVQLVRLSRAYDDNNQDYEKNRKNEIKAALHAGWIMRKNVNPYGFEIVK